MGLFFATDSPKRNFLLDSVVLIRYTDIPEGTKPDI
jgi:hypothetical protein